MRLSHTLHHFVLLAGAALPSAYAWGYAGHEIVATIAQIHIHPSALPVLCDLLHIIPSDNSEATLRRQCHLAREASWADREKKSIPWSKEMHYINAVGDEPGSNCQFPGPGGWEGPKNINVLDAFKNVSRILGEWRGVNEHEVGGRTSQRDAIRRPGPLEEEAFKFLIHFVGDMHQPLHLTGHYGGGNRRKVWYGGKVNDLHSVWDTVILNRLIQTANSTYSRPLPDYRNLTVPSQQIEDALGNARYHRLIRRVMWEGIENRWTNDIDDWLSCPATAPIPADTTPENPTLLSLLPTMFSDPLALPQKLLNALDGRQRIDIQPDGPVLCPYAWAAPLHQLNCRYVWNFTKFAPRPLSSSPFPVLDTPEYMGPLDRDLVMEKLLAQGGLRLAGILNWLFAEDHA